MCVSAGLITHAAPKNNSMHIWCAHGGWNWKSRARDAAAEGKFLLRANQLRLNWATLCYAAQIYIFPYPFVYALSEQ